jgi:hypothetical protein
VNLSSGYFLRIAVIGGTLVGAGLAGVPRVADPVKIQNTRVTLTQVCVAILNYRKDVGVAPKGDTASIMNALRYAENNPANSVFFDAPMSSINGKGELLDPWGAVIRIGTFPSGAGWAYSFGPNGIDEGGTEGSDDIASWRNGNTTVFEKAASQ